MVWRYRAVSVRRLWWQPLDFPLCHCPISLSIVSPVCFNLEPQRLFRTAQTFPSYLVSLHIKERFLVASTRAPNVGMMFKCALMHREPVYMAGENTN